MKIENSQLPDGWEIKKLGDICEIKPPKKIAKEKLSENDLVTFFPMVDLKEYNHYIVPIKTKYLKDVYSGYVYFENNDVLLAKITPCFENGKLGIAKDLKNGIGFGSSEYMVFRPKVGILSEYIYYFLSLENIRREGKNRMTGAVGHKRIPVDYLSNQNLITPPLPEQKRIVAILDKAFATTAKAKANAEQNLKNAKELFESYLQGVFENKGEGWKEKTLGEVCEFRNGKAHEKHIVENGKYILINSKFISSDGLKYKRTNSQLSPLYLGDIVFVMSDVPNGKALAKCFLVDKNDTYTLNQRICVIRSKYYDKKFLYYHLNRHKFLLSFNNGENQTNLRKNDILNCPLFLFDQSEQRTIVKKLDALSTETKKLEAIYQQKIDNLEELKKSALQKAFNGEL